MQLTNNEILDGELLSAEALFVQGQSKAERGDYVGALKDYTQAILLDPDYARAYGNRGFLRADQGDFFGAREDYQKAAQLFLSQGKTANYQMVMDYLRKLKHL